MSRITIELLRKRSEHNEGEISTLEEISLHQENIEKIELLNHACPNLKILLLQYNLISKIENIYKLKKLEYLNLAINNIEIIENFEGLESLKKLDLTVNFIGDLRGVKTLSQNEHLEQLIMSGNPCCDYRRYREYIVATLPQLKELDMIKIEHSERIEALQRYAEFEGSVIQEYKKYMKYRQEQKLSRIKIITVNSEEKQKEYSANEDKNFWNTPSYHTPEDRIAIAKKIMQRDKKQESKYYENQKIKHVIKLFSSDGRPYNINQAKIPFRLNDEDDNDKITLDIALYKHLDTSYIDVDVQPNYVRITIKRKILQLALLCEVATDSSTAQRNVISGNLLIIMPKIQKSTNFVKPYLFANKNKKSKNKCTIRATSEVTKRELLEIGPPNKYNEDFLKVNKKKAQTKSILKDENFYENPNVPALE